MSQENYLYHIDRVESNDTLYGSDPKFLAEIIKISTIIYSEVLSSLKQMGTGRKQSGLALELVVRILGRTNLNAKGNLNVIMGLWQLAAKSEYNDLKQIVSFL